MKMNGASIITGLLERQGIRTIPGIPGGCNLPLYDALKDSTIRHVLARHEQGAGFIAQGMARATGKAAVCLATSGPGATNLLTAIADAKLDSVPIVAITGQVPSALIGTDAFQEVDTYGLTLPITKHNFIVRHAVELLEVIPEAFAIAESGRPGPVVVDVPKDVQLQEITFDEWPLPRHTQQTASVTDEQIADLAEIIHDAERPVLFIGGGVIASGASEALIAIARKNSIPVASTLAGLGAFPPDDPLCLGMLGMHGAPFTNEILHECDLLIALGVRFDDRATGKVSAFCPGARIAHIDIDPSEIGKIKSADLAIVADVAQVLAHLLPRMEDNPRTDWTDHLARLKMERPMPSPPSDGPFSPMHLIRRMSQMMGNRAIVTTDVGQHQMWAAQAYPVRGPRTLLTSGGLGTMGFGLPAAIGAALARPGVPVLCISGDGSILMNIQELATLAEENLNVKIVVLNNQHLGLVRQQQELFYNERYHGSHFKSRTNLAAVAEGFGVRGIDLAHAEDPKDELARAFSKFGPCLIDIPIDSEELVLPMVAPGEANTNMIGAEANYA